MGNVKDAKITLISGQKYNIKVDYKEDAGSAQFIWNCQVIANLKN